MEEKEVYNSQDRNIRPGWKYDESSRTILSQSQATYSGSPVEMYTIYLNHESLRELALDCPDHVWVKEFRESTENFCFMIKYVGSYSETLMKDLISSAEVGIVTEVAYDRHLSLLVCSTNCNSYGNVRTFINKILDDSESSLDDATIDSCSKCFIYDGRLRQRCTVVPYRSVVCASKAFAHAVRDMKAHIGLQITQFKILSQKKYNIIKQQCKSDSPAEELATEKKNAFLCENNAFPICDSENDTLIESTRFGFGNISSSVQGNDRNVEGKHYSTVSNRNSKKITSAGCKQEGTVSTLNRPSDSESSYDNCINSLISKESSKKDLVIVPNSDYHSKENCESTFISHSSLQLDDCSVHSFAHAACLAKPVSVHHFTKMPSDLQNSENNSTTLLVPRNSSNGSRFIEKPKILSISNEKSDMASQTDHICESAQIDQNSCRVHDCQTEAHDETICTTVVNNAVVATEKQSKETRCPGVVKKGKNVAYVETFTSKEVDNLTDAAVKETSTTVVQRTANRSLKEKSEFKDSDEITNKVSYKTTVSMSLVRKQINSEFTNKCSRGISNDVKPPITDNLLVSGKTVQLDQLSNEVSSEAANPHKKPLCEETSPQSISSTTKKRLVEKRINCNGKCLTLIESEKSETHRVELGEKITGERGKVILLLGATGSGKTTLVNLFANFFCGTEAADNKFFFENMSLDTQRVTAYTFYQEEEPKIPITVIDTPGLNDSTGAEIHDRIDALKSYLAYSYSKGLEIHGVGFVAQAHLVRLTSSERMVMDYVKSLFGADVEKHLMALVTFADNQPVPQVIEAMEQYGFKDPFFVRFNNTLLVTKEVEVDDLDRVYWRMGMRSVRKCLKRLREMKPLSSTVVNALQDEVFNKCFTSKHKNGLQIELETLMKMAERPKRLKDVYSDDSLRQQRRSLWRAANIASVLDGGAHIDSKETLLIKAFEAHVRGKCYKNANVLLLFILLCKECVFRSAVLAIVKSLIQSEKLFMNFGEHQKRERKTSIVAYCHKCEKYCFYKRKNQKSTYSNWMIYECSCKCPSDVHGQKPGAPVISYAAQLKGRFLMTAARHLNDIAERYETDSCKFTVTQIVEALLYNEPDFMKTDVARILKNLKQIS